MTCDTVDHGALRATCDASMEPPAMSPPTSAADKVRGRAFWETIGSPKFVCAPMVDQSELAFRMLCRRYGTQLAYTPMFHSRLFSTQAQYRKQQWSTCPEDRPLFVQFCGDNPQTLLDAARQLPAGSFDAVDLNLGCPQGIARRGHYGAFLLSERDLLEGIVRTLDSELPVPVTIKMRLVSTASDLQDTMALASGLEAAGASVVTLHGRTKEMKGQSTGPCNWDAIAAVKKRLHVPVIANGGIHTYDDVVRCFEATGCDAVMSSESILETPSLFAPSVGKSQPLQAELALEYLELAKLHSTNHKCVKAHLFHFLYAGLQLHTDLRSQLGCAKAIDEMAAIASTLKARRTEDRLQGKNWPDSGWYKRYSQPLGERKKRKTDDLSECVAESAEQRRQRTGDGNEESACTDDQVKDNGACTEAEEPDTGVTACDVDPPPSG